MDNIGDRLGADTAIQRKRCPSYNLSKKTSALNYVIFVSSTTAYFNRFLASFPSKSAKSMALVEWGMLLQVIKVNPCDCISSTAPCANTACTPIHVGVDKPASTQECVVDNSQHEGATL